MNKNINFTLILLGCLFWIAGFFMAAAEVYPYCLPLIYISPVLLLTGIILWCIHYGKSNKRFPNPSLSYERVLSKHKCTNRYQNAAVDFLFSYVPHFWTFCIVFWMGLSFLSTSIFKNSDAFATTKKYIQVDSELTERIGQIKYYGFLIGGSISSSGNANLSFSVIGERGVVGVRSTLEQNEIIEVKYR